MYKVSVNDLEFQVKSNNVRMESKKIVIGDELEIEVGDCRVFFGVDKDIVIKTLED